MSLGSISISKPIIHKAQIIPIRFSSSSNPSVSLSGHNGKKRSLIKNKKKCIGDIEALLLTSSLSGAASIEALERNKGRV